MPSGLGVFELKGRLDVKLINNAHVKHNALLKCYGEQFQSEYFPCSNFRGYALTFNLFSLTFKLYIFIAY